VGARPTQMTADSTSISIRQLEASDWALLRDLRLAALEDAPLAFASTLAREQAFDEATWRSRCFTSCNLVAERDHVALGLVGVVVFEKSSGELVAWHDGPPEDPEFHLVSMWVRPDARRGGVARCLIEAAAGACLDRRATELVLFVAEGNEAALRAYEQAGFRANGETARLPHTPEICEHKLVRKLA
jgi:ribosomal protein S18 acetylase RimI-like enzyme